MVTNHLSAHTAILFKSELRRPADTAGRQQFQVE